jgi:hypothetical protein
MRFEKASTERPEIPMRRSLTWVALGILAPAFAVVVYGCGKMSAGGCADDATCAAADGSTGDTSVAVEATGEGAVVDAGNGGIYVEATSSSGGDADADADADGDVEAEAAVACDASRDPSVEPCLVTETYGIFVDSIHGDDLGGVGTRARPVKTISNGIAKAVGAMLSRVYVCNGTYTEQVQLGASTDGISLYGSYDCTSSSPSWTYARAAGTPPGAQVQGPTSLYALRIDGITKPVVIEDIAFSVPGASGTDGGAPDAGGANGTAGASDAGGANGGAGSSSIAAFVSHETAGVTFVRDVLQAGPGADGANAPAAPTNWYSADPDASAGNAADGSAGGDPKSCPCKQWGSSGGGAGGSAGDPAGDAGAGTATPAATPQGTRNGSGGAGYNETTSTCTGGLPGADGVAQMGGGSGATVPGALSALGWTPASGASGLAGNPGQGGGGGGGGQTGGGGGGGCGGCGGGGGLSGSGGGASIAILVLDSTVTFTASNLVTAAAGNGGAGANGESGSVGGGGSGGSTIGVSPGCPAGTGGNGAGGQGGGGGAGGVSIAILYTGPTVPMVDTTTTLNPGTPGTGGAPGAGGAGGAFGTFPASPGTPGTAGIVGVSQRAYSL